MFADLDGDHPKDAVLIDGSMLTIYYQDAKTGFPRKPQRPYRLCPFSMQTVFSDLGPVFIIVFSAMLLA